MLIAENEGVSIYSLFTGYSKELFFIMGYEKKSLTECLILLYYFKHIETDIH